MRKKQSLRLFPWQEYSKKVKKAISDPKHAGFFTEEETKQRKMRLVKGQAGDMSDGNFLRFYWIVDPDDGTIVDAKYQLFGQSALIGAAEITISLVVGKNYDQASRIGADLIDKQATDKGKTIAFPQETYPHLNLVIDAIDDAASQCQDIPLPSSYAAPPAPTDFGEVVEGGYPGWEELNIKQQISVIEHVLDEDIRPYISLDAGGVEVLNIIEGKELIITYQGTCTSCHSSTGATLSYIQQVMRAKVHPNISVVPQ